MQNTVNKKLIAISRFDFLIDGKENLEDAGTVQLRFSDNSVLDLELIPDGESVGFTWKDKVITEKDDKKTDWFKINLSERKPYDKLCGLKVTFIDILLFGSVEDTKEEMVTAGFGFRFENNFSLIYYNAGDFAKLYVNEMPPSFDSPFKLIWENEKF